MKNTYGECFDNWIGNKPIIKAVCMFMVFPVLLCLMVKDIIKSK